MKPPFHDTEDVERWLEEADDTRTREYDIDQLIKSLQEAKEKGVTKLEITYGTYYC